MTFVLSGEVRIDGTQAKGAVDSLRASQDGLKTSTARVTAEGSKAARQTQRLGTASATAAGQVDALSAQQKQAAADALAMGRSYQIAAGQVGNLGAQYNDVIVMMMAGQNPVQLAFQQGTQITQVIGPLGAAGAVRALGSAFMSLLNPVSLITIGSIAAGATMVNWLREGKEEAETLEDSLDRLKDASERLAASDGLAAAPQSAIAEYQNLIAVINEVDQLERQRAAEAVVRATGLADAITRNLSASSIAAQAGAGPVAFDFLGLDSLNEANFLLARTRELMAATRDEQAGVLDATVEALELRGILTAEVQAYVAQISNQLGITEQLADAEKERAGAARNTTLEAVELRFRMEDNARAAENARAALEAMPGALEGSVGLAAALADEIWRAARGIAEAVAEAPTADNGDATYQQMLHYQAYGESRNAAPDQPVKHRAPPGSRGGGGGATDRQAAALERLVTTQERQLAILRETDPVQREMLRYSETLAGATDSQRAAVEQLIGTRLREQAATENLTQTQDLFASAMHSGLDGLIFQGETLADVLDSVALAIGRASLEAALLGTGPLAGLLGFGNGGGLLGLAVNAISPVAASPVAAATGGYLTGPGSGTSDSISMLGSSGEFMVNAKATARHRPLLEAINSGTPVPGFARGGMIAPPLFGSGAAAGTGTSAGTGTQDRVLISILPSPEFNAVIKSTAEGVAVELLENYDRAVLPASVQRTLDDPRSIG